MTEETNAELIAEARTHVTDEYITPDTSAEESLIRRLASALEAAEQRAEEAERLAEVRRETIREYERENEAWSVRAHTAERERDRLDEAFDRDLPWRYDEVEAQRNQLAAVVEKALHHDPLHGESQGLHCGGMAPCIRSILTAAPADVLREVKAEAWYEGSVAQRMYVDNRRAGRNGTIPRNPYREGQS